MRDVVLVLRQAVLKGWYQWLLVFQPKVNHNKSKAQPRMKQSDCKSDVACKCSTLSG